MSVLLRDVKMPERCGDCQVESYCDLWRETSWDRRNSNCPLVEIPEPHGRLIDADAAEKEIVFAFNHFCADGFNFDYVNGYENGLIMAQNIVRGVPTIIKVPPHGDLIDRDEYRDEFMNGVYALCSDDSDNYRANAIIDLFDKAPTIIPAEEGEP